VHVADCGRIGGCCLLDSLVPHQQRKLQVRKVMCGKLFFTLVLVVPFCREWEWEFRADLYWIKVLYGMLRQSEVLLIHVFTLCMAQRSLRPVCAAPPLSSVTARASHGIQSRWRLHSVCRQQQRGKGDVFHMVLYAHVQLYFLPNQGSTASCRCNSNSNSNRQRRGAAYTHSIGSQARQLPGT
jgi:hypothetical protein